MKEMTYKTILMIFMAFFIASCDDDPMPDPSPVSDFTYVVEDLQVSFTNTSSNATSYDWDFGDSNSSADENPVHTYAESGSYTVSLTARMGGESNTKTETIDVAISPENQRRKSGFVFVGQDMNSSFVKYFEEFPTGTVDLTDGTAFQSFTPRAVIDGAIFLARTDGSAGLEKVAVNGLNEFVEDGIISTISSGSSTIGVRNSEFGVFHDRNDPNVVNIFNPKTMEVTGSIDMTAVSGVSPDPVRYLDFIFAGDKIFAPIVPEDNNSPGLPNIPVAVIDGSSQAATGYITNDSTGRVFAFNIGSRYVDENNTLYLMHGGNYSFPTESGAILKINEGSESFDPDYSFKVPEVHSDRVKNQGSFMSSFNYLKDNKGIALINADIDQQILNLIDERGGIDNLTPEDFQMVRGLLFSVPTGKFVLIDLVNQTTQEIANLPELNVFSGNNSVFLNGKPYFTIATPTENAVYEYDEATNSASKVVDVTGVPLVTVIDLSETIQ